MRDHQPIRNKRLWYLQRKYGETISKDQSLSYDLKTKTYACVFWTLAGFIFEKYLTSVSFSSCSIVADMRRAGVFIKAKTEDGTCQ